MTEPTTTPSASEYRVVTVVDLRHELQREHLIINAQLQTISNQVAALDSRFSDFREAIERRFDALDERLRFNKTLVVASISAVASAASVAVSLLR
jgi:prefoldin subunit 5